MHNSIAILVVFLIAALFLIVMKWSNPLRGFVQLGAFITSEIAFMCNKGLACENCFLSFGVCPIGTLQRMAFIRHFPVYGTLIFIAAIGLILGTLSCGWLCPVGFMQDLLHVIPVKEFKFFRTFTRLKVPVLVLLTVSVALEVQTGFLSQRGVSVFNPVFILTGFLILTIAVISKRFFCRILCPLGLIYGVFNKLSPIKVVLPGSQCTGCGKCANACITASQPQTEVNKSSCAKCYNCKTVCSKIGIHKTNNYAIIP